MIVSSNSKVKKEVNEIKTGAIISYCATFFNVLLGLIYTPWMIKQIGQSDYGLYSLSVSIIGMFAVDFGLGASVSRFISKYRATGEEKKINEFLGVTYKLYFIIDIVIFIMLFIIFFLLDNIYVNLTDFEIEKLRVIYCISGLFTLISFPCMPLNGILVSGEKFIFQKSVELTQKIIVVALMIITLSCGYGLYSLVLVNAGVGIILIIAKMLYIKKNMNYRVNLKVKNPKLVKEIFSFSIWTTAILISQRLILNITPSILGIAAGTEEIAIFSVGMTIEGYTYTFSNVISGMFLPKVSQLIYGEGKKNKTEIESLMIRVGRLQLIIVNFIIIGFFIFGKAFIYLWMGEEFKNSYFVALLLILPCIIIFTQNIASTVLIVENKIKYQAKSEAITALISIVTSLTLSNQFGAIGAAVGIFIGNVVGRVFVINIIYLTKIDINIYKFFKECHIDSIKCFSGLMIAGVCINSLNQIETWFDFIFNGILFSIVYIALVWNLYMNKSEKNLVKNAVDNIKIRIKMGVN